MRDIYHSNRGKFKLCTYYDKANTNQLDKYILNTKPKGVFYAREGVNRQQRATDVQGAFYINKNLTTLETSDEVDIIEGNVVLYMGQIWVVDNVSQELHQKETEFSSENHYTTYISIRR